VQQLHLHWHIFLRDYMNYIPNYQAKFEVPDGVYNSRDGVISELYTDISPLPTKAETSTAQEFPDMF